MLVTSWQGVEFSKAADAEAWRQTVMASADAHGGRWIECSTRYLSSTLRQLGVLDQMNARLYQAGIRSARTLKATCLEELPSRIYPIGYDGALELIRLLAGRRRPVLLGGVAHKSELLELLPWPRRPGSGELTATALGAYKHTKETGIHRTADLLALDTVALQSLWGSCYHDLVGGLLEMDMSPAPLLPTRRLHELDGPMPGYLNPQIQIGEVRSETVEGLISAWRRYQLEGSELEHTKSALRALWARNFTPWPD